MMRRLKKSSGIGIRSGRGTKKALPLLVGSPPLIRGASIVLACGGILLGYSENSAAQSQHEKAARNGDFDKHGRQKHGRQKHEKTGETSSPETPREKREGPRIYANSFLVWIYSDAQRDRTPIGYLRASQSASLRRPDPVSRSGCAGGWFAIQPEGYICHSRRTSFQKTRYVRSMETLAPARGAHPFRFALSMGTPSYRRVPTLEEAKRRERKYGKARPRTLPPHWRGHQQLVGAPVPEPEKRPWFLQSAGSVARSTERRLVRREVPFGSMLAVTGSFRSEGRTYLQSADGTVVPAERMQMFRRSTFAGVRLTQRLQLPVAWPRRDTKLYSLLPECLEKLGSSVEEGRLSPKETLPQRCLAPQSTTQKERSFVALSARRVKIAGTEFVETEQGDWLPRSYLFLAQQEPVPSPQTGRWIHFSIGEGTLVAYEGATPIFATLASPGIGGVPPPGSDPLSTRTTPVGTYRITFKHKSDDMSPEAGEHRSFWIADVPYAMYFKQPFAIHVAYWHDSFGEPMSGGCINVSPRDGARLFSWTRPALPDGWHGVGASKEFGLGTIIKIER